MHIAKLYYETGLLKTLNFIFQAYLYNMHLLTTNDLYLLYYIVIVIFKKNSHHLIVSTK